MRLKLTSLRWILALCAVALLIVGVYGCGGDDNLDPDTRTKPVSRAGAESQCVEGSAGLCKPRDVSGYDPFSSSQGSGSGYVTSGEPSVEEILDAGLELVGASPTHVA